MLANIKERGFTMVELAVAMTLILTISVGIFGVFTNYFVQIVRNNTFIDLTVDSQNLLRSTVEELRYGSGVRQASTIPDANGPSGGWSTSNTSFVIIIAVPAVDVNNDYIIDPDTGNPYNNELVYFKEGTILYKRTLANPAAVGNRATTSCPESVASNICPADRKLIDNIKTMTFTLYDQDDVLTSDALLARSVSINLQLEKASFGENLTFDNAIRVTLRNNFQ